MRRPSCVNPGPWPSGKAPPLQGGDRRFESDRVHLNNAGGFWRHEKPKANSNMRAWLSGRASPCQGESRGFESHRPLCIAHSCGRGSVVEHLLAKERVVGSNPIARSVRSSASIRACRSAEVAQLVEHVTENDGVPSSSLGLGTQFTHREIGDRLMAGQGTLDPCIEVRVLVPEPASVRSR